MSTSIDERVVEMRFDNSKFEPNAKTTLSTLDKLKEAIKFENASKSLEGISQAASNFKMDGMGNAVESVSAKFSALQVAAATVLANITTEAYQAGKQIVSALTINGARDGFAEYEEKMGSVQTIMNGTGESLETVMGYLEELNHYADQTIYSFSDMTASIGKFTNAGVDLKTSVAAIQGISNAVALSGGGADKASMAMYNFAQALSVGYVGLMDWKSIELSGMATLKFKQQVMDTAVALGTLKKEADGTYKTIDKGVEVTAEGMRESLRQQWFTSDVLTTVLAQYSDTSTKLGQDATEAATKVKTFSMMIDTLKESIGSGWAVSWEKMIGNFNQASNLFTNATNAISAVIDAQSDARNAFLDAAFNKEGITSSDEWTQLRNTIGGAGADAEQFKQVLIETARENGVAIDSLIDDYGSFDKSLSSGWLSPEILDKTVTKIEKLGLVAPQFRDLATAVNASNKYFRQLKDNFDQVSGRTHVINSLTNIMKALAAVLKPIKEAFRDIFPAKTGEDLRKALGSFEEFTKKLIISSDTAERIKVAFTGFFKLLEKGISTVKSIATAFAPLGSIMKVLVVNLLGGAERIGKLFNTIDDGKESISGFQKVLNAIHDGLRYFADNLQSYIDGAKAKLSGFKEFLTGGWNLDSLNSISDVFAKIKESLTGFAGNAFDKIKELFAVLSEHINFGGFEKVGDFLGKFFDKLANIKDKISSLIKPMVDKIKEFVSGINLIDVLGTGIEAGGFAAIVSALSKIASTIAGLGKNFGTIVSPVDALKKMINEITNVFQSLEKRLNAETLSNTVKEFAISVGILAGAIFILSSIDADSAKASVSVISVLIAEVLGVFATLSKLNGTGNTNPITSWVDALQQGFAQLKEATKLMTIAAVMQKLAISVGILAAALAVLSFIPVDQLLVSFGVISLLMVGLVAAVKELSSIQGEISKTAGVMLVLSSSLMILAVAMKLMSSIPWPELLIGFGVLTVTIGELIAVTKLLESAKDMSGAGVMIALAGAVLIMSTALKSLSSLNIEQVSVGLFAIAGVLLELGVALALMPNALPGAAALLVASAGILVLAGALKVMSSINSEKIIPILKLLGGVLLELALGLTAMIVALPGAAALVVAAKGIAMLAVALGALSLMDSGKLTTALKSLVISLATIAGVTTVLSIVSPLILAFAAALGVLGVALIGVGAGITLLSTGLLGLAVSLQLFSAVSEVAIDGIISIIKKLLTAIISLIPDMAIAFGEGILQIAEVIIAGKDTIMAAFNAIVEIIIQVLTENIPNIVDAFGQLIVSLYESGVTYIPQVVDLFMRIIDGILGAIAENLPTIIQSGVDIMVAFIEGVQSANNQLIDAAMAAMVAFINGLAESIEVHSQELADAVSRLGDAIINAFLLSLSVGSKFLEKAKELIDKFKEGVSQKAKDVIKAFEKMISDIFEAVKKKANDFKDMAKDLVAGFIDGIKEKVADAVNAATEMASKVVESVKKKLSIHSPSKVFYGIGNYTVQGFANALRDGTHMVSNASVKMVGSAIDTARDLIDAGMDLSPTIKPVVDLSNVKASGSEISRLTSKWKNISIDATANLAASASDSFEKVVLAKANVNIESSNGKPEVQPTQYNFTQNNYSPKSLSNLEIYRQTNAQLKQLKGLVTT